jgi:aerobic-type carbon monoxide dehydrogenase small subunit (CoxS/CutS family)
MTTSASDGGTYDGGGFAGHGEPPVSVTLTVDEVVYTITADPTMASLKAIREVAAHTRPRRGCQEGICGKCESKVNGADTRLCITPIGTLEGAVIVTPAPRKSIFG